MRAGQCLLGFVLAISGTRVLGQAMLAIPEPLPELYSPEDPEGFLPVLELPEPELEPTTEDSPSVQLEEAEDSSSPLTIWSPNEAGFMHQGRRKALSLGKAALSLPRRTRIYTGARGLIALGARQRFFAVLEAKTALHSAETEKGWRWTFLDGEAKMRLSCLGEAPHIRWKNPLDEIWELLRLKPDAQADFLLSQESGSLAIYQLRGSSKLILPSAQLLPGRPAGLLRSLQDKQLSVLSDGRTRILLLPGQVLRLVKKDGGFQLTIGLPDPNLWGNRLLMSSPETLQKDSDSDISEASVESLRRQILEDRLGSLVRSEESVLQLLRTARYEESLYILRRLSDTEQRRMGQSLLALEALLLYRLQQIPEAREISARLIKGSPWIPLLEEENRQSLLRSKSTTSAELSRPKLAHVLTPLRAYERYSLALSWQRVGEARAALDAWELPTSDAASLLQEKSREEWLEDIFERKRWSLRLDLSFGHESNVTQSPADEETLFAFERRDSFLGHIRTELDRIIDRSSSHSLSLRLSTENVFYARPPLSGLGLADLRVSLPLSLKEMIADEFWLEPFLGYRQRSSEAALDLYGIDAGGKLVFSSGVYEWQLLQMLGLDRDPGGLAPFDVESGEKGLPGDQSLKKTRLGFGWDRPLNGAWAQRFALAWEQRDYLDKGHAAWDRDIFSFSARASYRWSPILGLNGVSELLVYRFELGSTQLGKHLGVQLDLRSNLRWVHGLRLELRDEASTLYQTTQRSLGMHLSSSYSW